MRRHIVAVCIAVGILTAMTALGHHSFSAEYDIAKPTHLEGKIARITWTNPHVEVVLDVVDKSGATVQWQINLSSPALLQLNGLSQDFLKPGSLVRFGGYPAKNGTNHFGGTNLTVNATQKSFKTPACWSRDPSTLDLSKCPIPEVP